MSNFNPRSPHGERRGAQEEGGNAGYFNPRSPHGERPQLSLQRFAHPIISIHAPRTGSDGKRISMWSLIPQFQSTLPARGATKVKQVHAGTKHISIHAPRTGSDLVTLPRIGHSTISIHAPRTGSDEAYKAFVDKFKPFQSTLPARGATRRSPDERARIVFQSTLPARGATSDARG